MGTGVKRLERDADHSPPSIAEVKNERQYNSAPYPRLHGIYGKSLHFIDTRLQLLTFWSLNGHKYLTRCLHERLFFLFSKSARQPMGPTQPPTQAISQFLPEGKADGGVKKLTTNLHLTQSFKKK
jgi:hypothetical protein